MTRNLLRVAAVLILAAGASACSTAPDWVDPTTWIGGDDTSTTAGPPPDQGDQGQTVGEASDTGQYPDLANAPPKPAAPSTSEDQAETANQLAADRNNAQYSGDALRGGTEPAAAPPPPPGATPDIQQADNGGDRSAQARNDQASGNQAVASDQSSAPMPGDNSQSSDTVNAGAVAAGQTPPSAPDNSADAAVGPDNGAAGAMPAPAPSTRVANANMPPQNYAPGSGPAVPPVSGAAAPMPGMQPMVMADVPLGFRPSSAPALDPAVAQFVSAPVIARYQQTASNAGMTTNTTMPASYSLGTSAVALNAPRGTRRSHLQTGTTDVGGPEGMSGSVVASFDALNGPSAGGPSVYSNAYGAPAGVVYFTNDVAAVGPQGRAQIEQAVAAWRARGGQGYIRVVGHSSSRTGNMPVEKHLEIIFNRSQAYANAVGRELIHAGIPAKQVLIEAVGDSQPVYYESMPQGETGNRRAEIYLQG